MSRRIGSMLVAVIGLVLTSAVGAVAQQEQSGEAKQPLSGSMDMSKMKKDPAKGPNMTAAKMMEGCQEMKEQKQRMKEDMKAQDTQLTEQLTEMNGAPEDKKMGLVAAVLTKMAEQRITMDARMAEMDEAMMKHMMQHMQMGKESMSQCPMMKDMDKTSAVAHTEHQEEVK
jgi:hypothetical protein